MRETEPKPSTHEEVPADEARFYSSKLGRWKWTFLILLVLLFVFVEFSRVQVFPYLDSLSGRLMMDLVILVGAVFFFGASFSLIDRLETRLARQNREVLALHGAALDIYGEVSLSMILQKVVSQAGELLDAVYAAVAVYDEDGEIKDFFTAGVNDEIKSIIGAPPKGQGLLGYVLDTSERLRIGNIREDPRAGGFPSDHPEMTSLLAVPIVCKSPFKGNLYVADKRSKMEFTTEDEATLVRFSTAAAIAIDNAHMNHRLRALAIAEERVRIARELHDGMAQILAYVNTKAQAVKAYLDRSKTEEAGQQLEQLASAARDVYKDAREGILALRTQVGPDQPLDEALDEFLEVWEGQSGIPCQLEIVGELEIPTTIELQLLRIIQEALSNARKHSGASKTEVHLQMFENRLAVRIEDNGAGFDPKLLQPTEFPRFGLAIMRERAESVGGSLHIDTSPGKGTRVIIEVPIQSETT